MVRAMPERCKFASNKVNDLQIAARAARYVGIGNLMALRRGLGATSCIFV
jgi:hypothetical protein